MSTLKHVHEYIIESEKIDMCPSEFDGSFPVMVLNIGLVVSIYVGLMLSSVIIGTTLVLSTLLLFLFILGVGSDSSKKCGVHITLTDNEREINGQYYRFTDNPERDVAEIEKIVARFNTAATERHDLHVKYDAIDKEQKQSCCNQYQERIVKVKLE